MSTELWVTLEVGGSAHGVYLGNGVYLHFLFLFGCSLMLSVKWFIQVFLSNPWILQESSKHESSTLMVHLN
jgi:hypothetical protein